MNKYADVAVPEAIRALEHIGCRRVDMEAKIAGGASIFDLGRAVEGGDIGRRNVEAVIRALEEQGIPCWARMSAGARVGRSSSRSTRENWRSRRSAASVARCDGRVTTLAPLKRGWGQRGSGPERR